MYKPEYLPSVDRYFEINEYLHELSPVAADKFAECIEFALLSSYVSCVRG